MKVSMRRASIISAAVACLAVAACGDEGSGGGPPAAVAARDLAVTFAPLVRLDGRERAFPASAAHLLAHSGLEWGEGGRCGYGRDVTPSATLTAGSPSPLPPLVARRLGRAPGYRARALRPDCETPRDAVFSSTQHTRPYDPENRPRGLRVTEGFNLDIASDVLYGKRRLGPDGSLTGVPAYYALERERRGGRDGIRISYWLAFGLQLPSKDARLATREGDWERVDVLTRSVRAARGAYVPFAVEHHADDGVRTVAWAEAERADGTHPVAYLDRGMHTPRPSGSCDRCIEWETWRRLRDVRREPWFGYGGGWGAIGDSDRESGPAGPSPFVLGQAP